MTPGQQIVARIGFETLTAKTIYHVIADDQLNGRTILASFGEKLNQYQLRILKTSHIRKALEDNLVRHCTADETRRLPPWLSNRENDCLNYSEKLFEGNNGHKSEYEGVEERLKDVLEAIDDEEKIFSKANFSYEINKIARRLKRNEPRYRAWVITYLAFGRNRWALLAPTKNRGQYNRLQPSQTGTRRGRPSNDGKNHGYDVTESLKEKIILGFQKYAKSRKYLSDIHSDTLAYDIGCLNYENEKKQTVIYHPYGEPFPTYGQFRYWVIKIFGDEAVWSKLRGNQEFRNKHQAPKGRYSEGVYDLMEIVYIDASTSPEHPKSHFDDSALPKLVCAKAVDPASGMITGIAFGLSTERASLYKQAMASTAMPKQIYGMLFNIEITQDDWPVQHLPRSHHTDQGPGSTNSFRNAMSSEGYKSSPNMSPAYTPQSNAVVEANNPQEATASGAPIHKVSKKTAIELATDMVREVMAKNRSKSVTSRMTPTQTVGEICSPIQLWKHYEELGRQAGVRMNIADVVTNYLPRVTFIIREGYLTRNSIVYRSPELENTKLFKNIKKHNGVELDGWAFDISNRIEWVRVDKQIIMVSPVTNVRTRSMEEVLCAPDQARYGKAKKAADTKSKNLRSAEKVRLRNESLEQSGKKYNNPTHVKGRAKIRSPNKKKQASALNND